MLLASSSVNFFKVIRVIFKAVDLMRGFKAGLVEIETHHVEQFNQKVIVVTDQILEVRRRANGFYYLSN